MSMLLILNAASGLAYAACFKTTHCPWSDESNERTPRLKHVAGGNRQATLPEIGAEIEDVVVVSPSGLQGMSPTLNMRIRCVGALSPVSVRLATSRHLHLGSFGCDDQVSAVIISSNASPEKGHVSELSKFCCPNHLA